MKTKKLRKRLSIWALVIAAILLIPVVGQFNWDESDYIVTAIILVIVVSAINLSIKTAGKYKIAAIMGILFAAFWLYAELAVGIFTNWGS